MHQSPNQVPRVLSAGDLKKLNQILAMCNDTSCLCHALKELGLDCSEIEAGNAQHQQFAARAKAIFFPDQP